MVATTPKALKYFRFRLFLMEFPSQTTLYLSPFLDSAISRHFDYITALSRQYEP